MTAPSTSRGLWTFAGLIVIVVAFGAVLHHMRSICEEETVSEVSNGTYVAVTFHRDCQDNDTVHINLRKQGSRFGTDFMLGTIVEGEVLAAKEVTGPIEARWSGPQSLVISVPADSVFPSRYAPRNLHHRTLIPHMENAWRDVTITYQRQP